MVRCLILFQNVVAGFFPSRNEIAIDVSFRLEDIFDKTLLKQAVEQIFDKLDGSAKSMFGVTEESPDIVGLVNNAKSNVAFDFAFSTGIKVESALNVFSPGSTATSHYIRLENIHIVAEASFDSLNLPLYPGVNVEGGDFELSAGLRITTPSEAIVTSRGSLANDMPFSSFISNLVFEPHGILKSTLPFVAIINDSPHNLKIKFDDSNLFDTRMFSAKVDFPVCQISTIADGLLGKLASLHLSPEHILGPVEISGLTLPSLDALFPDVRQFFNGILV
jgi:hypothetical protein